MMQVWQSESFIVHTHVIELADNRLSKVLRDLLAVHHVLERCEAESDHAALHQNGPRNLAWAPVQGAWHKQHHACYSPGLQVPALTFYQAICSRSRAGSISVRGVPGQEGSDASCPPLYPPPIRVCR